MAAGKDGLGTRLTLYSETCWGGGEVHYYCQSMYTKSQKLQHVIIIGRKFYSRFKHTYIPQRGHKISTIRVGSCTYGRYTQGRKRSVHTSKGMQNQYYQGLFTYARDVYTGTE